MERMKNLLGVFLAVLLLATGAGIAGAAPGVVIDNSHGQSALLSGLADTLRAQGWEVDYVEPGESVEAALAGCNLLVVPQPLSEFTEGEVQAVHAWVEAEGGGLLVLYDSDAAQPYLNKLPAAFDVTFNAGVVWDWDSSIYWWTEDVLISIPAELPSHPLFTNVTDFVYLRGTSLNVSGSPEVLVRATGEYAYCESGAYDVGGLPPVLVANQVGAGRVVLLGDTTPLELPSGDLGAGNARLVTNIVSWLQKPEEQPEEQNDTIEVTINLRPWNHCNKITLHSRGFVRVAVMSDSDFKAADVAPKTVVFTGASPVCWKLMKVNRDRQKDLVLVFWIPDLIKDSDNENGLTCDSTTVELTGKTKDGTSIHGSDMVNIQKTGKCKPPKHDNCGGKKRK